MEGKKQTKIRVCSSRACASFGAKSVMKAISEKTGLEPGEKNGQYDLGWCGCRGLCSRAPNVEVDEIRVISDADPQTIMEKIEKGIGSDYTGRDIDIDNFLTDDGLDRID